MNLIKKYGAIAAVIVSAAILVIVRTTGSERFKYDLRKWAASSVEKSNLVSVADTGSLPGGKLLVDLDKPGNLNVQGASSHIIRIPPDSILNKKYFKMIVDNSGPVILSSDDPGLAARIWMVLSQTGHRNIYILTPDKDNEVFKYEFRTDTLPKANM